MLLQLQQDIIVHPTHTENCEKWNVSSIVQISSVKHKDTFCSLWWIPITKNHWMTFVNAHPKHKFLELVPVFDCHTIFSYLIFAIICVVGTNQLLLYLWISCKPNYLWPGWSWGTLLWISSLPPSRGFGHLGVQSLRRWAAPAAYLSPAGDKCFFCFLISV